MIIIEGLTVDEILEKVKSGELDAAEAMEREQQGKNRSTLVNALQAHIQSLLQGEGAKAPAQINVILLKNIRRQDGVRRKGEKLSVTEGEASSLIHSKLARLPE